MEISNELMLWETGTKLACPMLRFNAGRWIALEKDPCPTKKCKFRSCHNYGKNFDQPNRLRLIKTN